MSSLPIPTITTFATTPAGTVSLRLPPVADFEKLSDVARRGITPRGVEVPPLALGTLPPDERAASTLSWLEKTRAELAPRGRFIFAVYLNDEPIGLQDVRLENLGDGVVSTGSWLGVDYQGRGNGTCARELAVHLAFEVLGARMVRSEALEVNAVSRRVSEKLGYRVVASRYVEHLGQPQTMLTFELPRQGWVPSREVSVVGAEEFRAFVGV